MRSPRPLLLLILLSLNCGENRPRRGQTPPPGNSNNNTSTNNPVSGPEVTLQVRGYTRPYEAEGSPAPAGQAHIHVEADVVNSGQGTVEVLWRKFSLETTTAVHPVSELTTLLSGACDAQINGRGRQYCTLYFQIAADAQPRALVFHRDSGDLRSDIDDTMGPPQLCATPGPEDDFAACSDGCNNDGDGFSDCEDTDCCEHLSGCAPGTRCGGPMVQCVMGVEGSVSTCNDGCDNDNNSYSDCNDFGCCDLRACQQDTSCARQPDPFSLPLAFNDGSIQNIDPSNLLAGPTPCHDPVLVYVRSVRDGDTIDVSAITGDVSGAVRFIGIDTPEIAHGETPAECYGDEASAWSQQLRGRTVWLTFDNECKDRFDRNLAYIHYGEDRTQLVQRHLLRRGLARRLGFRGNDGLGELLENDAQIASAAGVGLWTACP